MELELILDFDLDLELEEEDKEDREEEEEEEKEFRINLTTSNRRWGKNNGHPMGLTFGCGGVYWESRDTQLSRHLGLVGCIGKVGTPNCPDIWVWWGVLGESGHPIVPTFGFGGVYWDWDWDLNWI